MYSYAIFKTRELAERFVEHQFASGLISSWEYCGIQYRGGRYHVMHRDY